MVRVELFTRAECSLCEVAKAVLDDVRGRIDFELVQVDITGDPEAFARYQWDIPVIHVDGHRAFKHRVEAGPLEARIRRAGAA